MEHQLPEVPYPIDSLSPYISAETLQFHHGKHHKAYVSKLNKLIKGTKFQDMSLEETIKNTEGALFNNAAQHWNHSFFWNCLTPSGKGYPAGKVNDLIMRRWGTFDKFKDEFAKSATANFGSGWTWLIHNSKDELEIMNTGNADNPLKHEAKAALTLDVWEHAYYIDYRNSRADFISAFWNIVNWDFVNKNLQET